MQLLYEIDEAEMVATFLRGELTSQRFGPAIRAILARDGRHIDVIAHPDVAQAGDNDYRARVLGEYHDYGRDQGLFQDVPRQIRWYRALATKEDLRHIRYINYSYWNELSGGSRLAANAAEQIRQGIEIFGLSNDGFWKMAKALRAGARFPELIMVRFGEREPPALLEGHMRLTAYFLALECIPPQLAVIVGYPG